MAAALERAAESTGATARRAKFAAASDCASMDRIAMTVKQTEINLKMVLTIVSLSAMLVSAGIAWGGMKAITAGIEEKILAIITDVAKHHADTDKHMSYEAKVRNFVSREEMALLRDEIRQLDVRQRQISSTLSRIEAQLSDCD